jgi:ribonuclease G
MTVIDVNTGKFTGTGSLEETVLETNLEAAEEIVRQLRLRNIGGLIVIDFIDMASSQSRNKLYRFLEQTLKENDKFQSVVLKVSEFGLVQMTRKRSGKTLAQQLMINCPTCHSLGIIKSLKTECYALLGKLKTELEIKKAAKVEVYVNIQMFNHLTSVEYDSVIDLERQLKCQIMLSSANDLQRHEYKIIVSE